MYNALKTRFCGIDIDDKKSFIINTIYISICILIVYIGIKYLLVLFVPFIVAVIIGAILSCPSRIISEKTGISIKIVSLILVCFIFIVLGFIVGILGYRIINSTLEITKEIINFAQNIFPQIIDRLTVYVESFPKEISDSIIGLNKDLTGAVQSYIIKIAASAGNSVASFTVTKLPEAVISSAVTVISTFYISTDYDKFISSIINIFPKNKRQTANKLKVFLGKTMAGLIKAHLILMIITFIELSIFLSIMRVRNSVIIAAFISLIDILPVLGTGTVLYPWGIISMISGNSALGISLIIAQLIMTIIRNIIEPRIIGTHTGLNPILTLASIYIGTKLFGFIGMYVFMLIIIMAVKYRNSASNN